MNNRPLALLKNPFPYPKRKNMGYTKMARSYNGWMKKLNLWGFPCPKCGRLTLFREDRNPELFICTECGTHKRRKRAEPPVAHRNKQPERDRLAREVQKTWKHREAQA